MIRILAIGLVLVSLWIYLSPGLSFFLTGFLVLTVTLVAMYLFVIGLAKNNALVFCSFTALLASIQLLAAPFAQYAYFSDNVSLELFNLLMQVGQEEYFCFALPAVMLFIGGMLFLHEDEIGFKGFVIERRIFISCLMVGIVSIFLREVLRLNFGSLGFLLHILTLFLPASLIHAHAQAIKEKKVRFKLLTWPLCFLVIWVLTGSIRSGMYSSVIFWGLVVISVSLAEIRTTISQRIILLVVGGVVAVSIQMSKGAYRELAWAQSGGSTKGYFSSLASGMQQVFDQEERELVQFNTLIRLNQGWHLSHVMARSQEESIRLGGQRSLEAIFASLLPRALWPSKPKAGGKENIKNFTYITLQEGTSMNISFFGDFYLDFGKVGGGIAVFFFGLLYRKALQRLFTWASKNQVIAITYPVILVGVIQIETDLLMIVNHAFKVFLVLWLLSGLIRGQNHGK